MADADERLLAKSGGGAVTMAVRAMALRPLVFPGRRPRHGLSWIVPAAALLLATSPTWLGVEFALPRPLARELQLLVISEAPRPPAPPVESVLPVVALPPPAAVTVAPEPLAPPVLPAVPPVRRSVPSLAVVGVGLQGLVMLSEPGGGEQIRLVDEGTDLRDLFEEREAGGRYWKRVRHPDGPVGWVASEYLLPWDGVDRDARTVALLERTAGVDPVAPRDRSWAHQPLEIRSITPDQLKDSQSLSTWESYAACGPAATVAFARAIGQDITLDQAVNAAREVGWNAWAGMPGPRTVTVRRASSTA